METYDICCPNCSTVNRHLYLDETDGWMECESCRQLVRIRNLHDAQVKYIPVYAPNWQLALMRFFIEYDTNFWSIIMGPVQQLKTGEDPFTTAANNTLIGKNCIDEWISDPTKINNYMRILTEGLIYLYEA